MTIYGSAKSHTMEELYQSLDDEFKARLDSNGCSLFRLLKLPNSRILPPLVNMFLSYYDSTQNVFIFGCHRLRITLEDVLFITGLPISGKPVIASSSRGADAFQRLFGDKNSLTMMELKSFATDKGLGNEKRMISVLLYVINSFITPTYDGHLHVATSYVEFVENLAEVDSYAWGAALLAFLYTGIKKWKDNKNYLSSTTLDGNIWLLLGFFFIRIPNLMEAVGYELPLENIPYHEPLVDRIVEKMGKIYKSYKSRYKENAVRVLNNLSDEDIKWLPYDSSWLPPRLLDQYQFRALVGPLFCNNYVVHHRPQLVPKQFGLTLGSVAGFDRYDYIINTEHNIGPDNLDYLTFYKKEIELWKEGNQLQDFISSKRSAYVAEASSPLRKKSKFNALNEQFAGELAEKLGTLTRLMSMDGIEQNIRSKIRTEAGEEKLNSELRAAQEKNGTFQGEVEKLMSEVRVAREMNVKLEDKIKSSEACEKNPNSKLQAAVLRNLKLRGEIKSSEAREEKLNSKLRAALEKNGIFQGEVEKLMSEVSVAREINVKLEDKIKSSEACEKNPKSKLQLQAAVLRNLKLRGEIKSSEAREKKLKSELQAAVLRNLKLRGEIKSAGAREEKLKSENEKIKHAVSLLANFVNH